MALTDKLTAIANAIRAKSGKTDTLTLDQMPTEISALTTEEIIQHADIPDYVKKEALEVAQKVRSVQTDESIVFLAMADSHYYGAQGESGVDTYVDENGAQGNVCNLHGAMGAKILAYALDFDFMAHLGDATWGHKTTTSELLNSQVDTLFDMLRESHANLPCFHAIGNHDTGLYYHNEMISKGNTGVYTETGESLYNKFTALSASDDTVFGDTTYGGYCYRDFTEKKLRVFLLNSCDTHVYNQTDSAMLGSQRLWFANALLDLNSKTDATEWSYMVLCHYPADYGGMMPFSELLRAYVEGGSITITTESGTSSTVNFSGKNGAKFIVQLHGHVHNFKTSKLYSYATGKGVQYDAWRMCIPNGQYNRENYYSTVGSYTDIDFSEDTSYTKTANTANDTSFVVNVINPSEEKIYSFCYGAGYDRVIGYAATVYYSVTATLKNVTNSNDAVSVENGKSYSTTLTPTDGYVFSSVVVTMSGVDVTSSVYSDGVITIPEVTGNISITATAVIELNVTNQLPISTDTDGSIYNGVGYKADTYLSGNPASKTGYYTSGFIPCTIADTLYFKNVTMQTGNNYHRISAWDADKNFIANSQFATNNTQSHVNFNFGDDGNIESISFTSNSSYYKNAAYIRFCCSYIGADSIVTVNEPIE